jgi:hypothetical protein
MKWVTNERTGSCFCVSHLILCETSRNQHFLDSRLISGGEVSSLARLPFCNIQKDSWYSFLLEAEYIQASLRLFIWVSLRGRRCSMSVVAFHFLRRETGKGCGKKSNYVAWAEMNVKSCCFSIWREIWRLLLRLIPQNTLCSCPYVSLCALCDLSRNETQRTAAAALDGLATRFLAPF